MYFRNAFAFSSVLLLTAASGSTSSRALAAEAADSKEACLTAADTGQSLRDDGQYAMARDQFLACARDACPRLVHEQCTEWLRSLDEATPTVVFGAKDEHGNDVGAARVLSDGKLITTMDTCGDSDDLFMDAKRGRVYVSCGAGFVDVFEAKGEAYRRIARIPTVSGARTSLFVPELDRLLVAARANGKEPAAIWIFRPIP